MSQYSLVSSSWGAAEYGAIQRVLDSGQFTMGREVALFEKAFARRFGSRYAVMVNSGSSANLLAVAALHHRRVNPWRPGEEVIVPSVSWSTTYFPVHQYGMRLVFCDIDRDTLNLDPAALSSALSDRTRGILVPSILGNPAALDVLKDFCEERGLELLEDNCESMGAALHGRPVGTWGLMGTFSCFFSHHISTMEGGVVVTDDEELHDILLSLRAHGWTRNLAAKNRVCRKGQDPFRESYRFVLPGYNVRPLEMSGAVGREQLKKLPGIVAARRKNARAFQEQLAEDGRFLLQQETGRASWFGFSLVVQSRARISRKKVLDVLAKNGIEVRPIVAGNFLVNDVIRHLSHRVVGDHVNAQLIHDRGFFVGNHPRPMDEEIECLAAALSSIR
ncbi:MAG: DegT/DnrJ/EryC1/StrS family aminotransferase [Thermoplasmatota archaeon]